MNPTDNMEGELEMPTLCLQYTQQNNEEDFLNFLQYPNNQEINFELMKKTIFERFCKKEYVELQQDLLQSGWDNIQIADFFSEKGDTILSWATVNAIDNEPLSFLLKNIPTEVLKTILSHKNYYILQSFILSEKNHEQFGWADEKNKNMQIERFKLLLKIDEHGVSNFMRESNITTERIKQNYLIAVKQLELNLTV